MTSFPAGLFVSTLILSLVFASRLRPASRAPLLFRPDTNIQVLLDLKYNLSAEGISCITCSGEGPAGRAPSLSATSCAHVPLNEFSSRWLWEAQAEETASSTRDGHCNRR